MKRRSGEQRRQSANGVHAVCTRRVGGVRAVCVQCACDVHAACMPRACVALVSAFQSCGAAALIPAWVGHALRRVVLLPLFCSFAEVQPDDATLRTVNNFGEQLARRVKRGQAACTERDRICTQEVRR
eukprot:scaffold735_cov68-Phaeocystis_antarctica.AAC.3